LSKTFYKISSKTRVLRGIDLNIYEGEHIGLLGSNGAGKTTLIEIVAGINKPSKGKIFYNFPFENTPQEQIGIQFQDATCPAGLTVFDIISFQNDINKEKIDSQDLYNLIKAFKLEELLAKKANKLSGGQQQRLNVFLAIMSNPKILFLDELSTALDIQMQLLLNSFLLKYIKENNVTLIMSSHNVQEIEKFVNRIVIIKNGKIALDVPKNAIINHFGSLTYFLDNYLRI